jgi:nucleotide-binding universal stress UspA family protein
MADRIVVPLDGSKTAEAILPQVLRFAAADDATELVLVRMEAPIPAENGAVLLQSALASAEAYLAGVQARLQEQGRRVRIVVRAGAAAEGVLNAAAETGADLIAMATHGRGGLARVLLGSVAERILRASPVPVLLLRPFWSYEMLPEGGVEQMPLRTILLPVDGSGLALCAVPAASRVARRFGAEVLVLHVLVKGEDPTAVRGQLDDLRERFAIDGVSARVALEQGDPAQAILAAAKNGKADLVVLSTHGRSGLSRLVVGSVTEAVAREAKTPLLVVRGVGAVKREGKGRGGSSSAPRGKASSG